MLRKFRHFVEKGIMETILSKMATTLNYGKLAKLKIFTLLFNSHHSYLKIPLQI